MKLSRFEAFIEQIDSDALLKKSTLSAEIYRYWDRKWYDRKGNVILDSVLIDLLGKSRRFDKPTGSGVISFYSSKKFDAVVQCKTRTSTRESTRLKLNRAVLACEERAAYKFDANHSTLTGLINRNNFISKFTDEINDAKRRVDQAKNIDHFLSSLNISVFSIDIDKFKQINDYHTHQYGDVVLKCVADRIESTCTKIQTEGNGDIGIICAHPSGEEFLVLVSNAPNKAIVMEIAERIRAAISDVQLPSDKEWPVMSRNVIPEGFSLPDAGQRNVTISIGTSSINTSDIGMNASDIIAKMLVCSDVALQRSKSAGRNRVTDFSDILSSHGRVLQTYPETGVICINIGSHVGVPYRQEFWIYEEKFYNQADVSISDGRTSRKIGKFPKKASGRIIVFDVQNEISFCSVEKKYGNGEFSVGSVVIPVPIGAIGHVVYPDHNEDMIVYDLADSEEFDQLCDQLYEKGDLSVISITLTNAKDIAGRRGTSYVNIILSEIYIQLHKIVKGNKNINQFNDRTFSIALEKEDKEKEKKIINISNELKERYREEMKISYGICSKKSCNKDGVSVKKGNVLKTLSAHTAFVAGADNKLAYTFAKSAGALILNNIIKVGDSDFEDMYDLMKDIGVDDSECAGQCGVYYWRKGDVSKSLKMAEIALEKALEIDANLSSNEQAQFCLQNKATALYSLGETDKSFECFKSLLAVNRKIVLQRGYAFVAAMVYYDKFIASPDQVNVKDMKELFSFSEEYYRLINISASPSEYKTRKARVSILSE